MNKVDQLLNTTPELIIDCAHIEDKARDKSLSWFGVFECKFCGLLFVANKYKVTKNITKSCGCQKEYKGNPIHGYSKYRLYAMWNAMLNRCHNIKDKNYTNYGGRGITVCSAWFDFKTFNTWAEEGFQEGLSLDRIDNDGNYEPDNCRWTSTYIQNTNQRKRKDNTSGFVGIHWNERGKAWIARVSIDSKRVNIGRFKILEDAINARDSYILLNNLPHKLSIDYEEVK